MWLPVDHSFSRNDTVRNITADKYLNIRGMFGGSADGPTNPWMTAKQAISDGTEANPTYSLFKMGAACWCVNVPALHLPSENTH